MIPLFHDAAIGEVEDVVRPPDGGDAVGDEKDGPFPAPGGEVAHHGLLGSRVEGRGGLVEHQNRRVAHHGPGDGEPLPLAGGELAAAIRKHGVEALRQAGDVVLHGRHPHRFPHPLVVRAGGGVADVVPHGHGEQHVFLQRDGDVGAQAGDAVVAQVPAVDADAAALGIEQPQQQRGDGALAGAGGADDGGD